MKSTQLVLIVLLALQLAACSLPIKQNDTPLSNETSTHTKTPKTLSDILDQNCTPPEANDLASQWEPLDLWERIRHGYALPPQSNKRINQQRNWFKKHPEYIDRVSERGSRYLFHIVEELEARQMPMEIAYLPVVESAFDPFAYSPGRASGMWQIIPGTGKMLGLKQGWWYDGRRDAVASTDAALNYLTKLNRQFKGDWLLALAAYNSGAGTVNKAIRKNKRKGKPTDFWNLDLPRETRGYVPRLIALAELFHSPEKYGLSLIEMPNKPYFDAVHVGGQIDLAQAAMLAEISMDELYKLNAGFNRWATDPDGPHHLLIPVESAETFLTALDTIPANQRIKWQRHTIKSGETLSHIAKKYDVSVGALKSINQLRNSSIRAGKTLMVPTATKGSGHYSHSIGQRLTRKQESGGRGNKQKLTHVVQSGDSFWDLGRAYKVKGAHIAKWNNMAPRDTLKVGQKLVIWVDNPNARSKSPHTNEQVIRKLSYRVRNGDSLSKIASKFRVAVNDIVKWNHIKKQKYLQPGQSLVLYVDVKS